MIRVVRLTRHPLQEGQREALLRAAQELLGAEAIEVIEEAVTVSSAEEVVALVEQHGAQLLEAVLPIGLLAQVVPALKARGVPVVRSVMERQLTEQGEAIFTFRGYELVERVEIVTRPLP